MPIFQYVTPRKLPKAARLEGRVVVLDIAFAADIGSVSFDSVTKPFIEGLGSRLAAWVDHHDHERHIDFVDDPRFVLATKAQHPACPEMVTPALVHRVGPVDTLAVHLDLDGIYAGAKWVLKGQEPYEGADADARAVDTRRGVPGPVGARIDQALRARFRDEGLKHRIVRYLVSGCSDKGLWEDIDAAAQLIDPLFDQARRHAERFRVDGQVAYVKIEGGRPYDKTELLLLGQQKARVSVVHDVGSLAVAADFESGLDFVAMFDLGGGMPTRVSVPESRLTEVMDKLARVQAAPES